MADTTTHEALRAHLEKWRKKEGFNSGPFAERDEAIRFLCERIDAMPKWEEFKLKRTFRTPKNGVALRVDEGKR